MNGLFRHFMDNFINEPELIFFCSMLNDFKYFYLTRIILFTFNHLFMQI